MITRGLKFAALAGAFLCFFLLQAVAEENAEAKKPEPVSAEKLRADIDRAIKRALAYYEKIIKEDGSYGVMFPDKEGNLKYADDVGITGLVVTAVAKSPFAEEELKKDYAGKAIAYLEKHVQKDGSIANPGQGLTVYKTAIAIMAFNALNNPDKYGVIIENGQKFLKREQFDEDDKIDKKHHRYGGIGYGHVVRPSIPPTEFALEALRETGVDPNDEVFKKAVAFLQRCQNLTDTNDFDQTNDRVIPINDGGARHSPVSSKVEVDAPEGKLLLPSYGSMTAAFLKSMIHCGVDRNDPRLRAAFRWILKNYTFERNPGFSTTLKKNADKQGLYYYYHTMSKALLLYGAHILHTPDGKTHNWAVELAQKIISVQQEDGSWVNKYEERWYEGNPSLVTSYCILALINCKNELAAQEKYRAGTVKRVKSTNLEMAQTIKDMRSGKITTEEGDKKMEKLMCEKSELEKRLTELEETVSFKE